MYTNSVSLYRWTKGNFHILWIKPNNFVLSCFFLSCCVFEINDKNHRRLSLLRVQAFVLFVLTPLHPSASVNEFPSPLSSLIDGRRTMEWSASARTLNKDNLIIFINSLGKGATWTKISLNKMVDFFTRNIEASFGPLKNCRIQQYWQSYYIITFFIQASEWYLSIYENEYWKEFDFARGSKIIYILCDIFSIILVYRGYVCVVYSYIQFARHAFMYVNARVGPVCIAWDNT